jgi:hypothetical protein
MQEGGTVDPVSGNDVPPGAMAEEVRDDIDAKLSEGEFVIPADVVRYIGLEKLMMMRDKAKAGLKRMNDIGQMGNAEEVEDAEALHGGEDEMDDETFSSEIDSIIGEEGEQEYSAGGDVRKYQVGGYVGGETNKELYRDAPIRGFEMVAMTNDAGQTIYIPFINGKPQLAIPQGYRVRTSDLTTTTPTPTTGEGISTPQPADGGGASDGEGASAAPSSPGFSIGEEGFAVANETSTTTGSMAGAALAMALGLSPALGAQAGKGLTGLSNFANAQAAMNFNVAVSDTTAAANNEGVTTAAATTGPSGTGGAAASAAASAAAAAAANGMSAEAQGAASQAAADATVSGASPSAAAAAGANAAAAADQGDVAEGGSMAAAADAAAAAAASAAPAGETGVSAAGEAAGGAPSGGGADNGGDAGASDGSGPGAGAGTGGASPGDSGDGGTGAASSAGDGGASAGDGGASAGDGSGWAKGGFVSKKKKTTVPKSTSLVSRRK